MKRIIRRVEINAHINSRIFVITLFKVKFKEPKEVTSLSKLIFALCDLQLIGLFIKPKTNPKTKLKLNLILGD